MWLRQTSLFGGEGWGEGPEPASDFACGSTWFSPAQRWLNTGCPCDGNCYGVNIIKYVFVREPHYGPALFFDFLLSITVLLDNDIVVATIEFNDQPFFNTCEVGDELANRVLPAELKSA
jgi:hypothetical protein